MFQFPRLPLLTYEFSKQYWPMTTSGFPHSDIHASTLAYSSTWHFGVRPVLLRLLAPRHPPCALPNFTIRLSICFVWLRHSVHSVSHVLLYAPSLVLFVPCPTRTLPISVRLPICYASRNPNRCLTSQV